jgi:sulfonate transport system substrate-binding protein
MTKYKSKIIHVMALCFSALVLFANSAWCAPKIKMASRLEYWDVLYREAAFDLKYGVDARAIPYATGVKVVSALQSGAIDVASSGHVPLTLLLSRTDRVIVLASGPFNRGSVYRMVVGKNTPYRTIEDLKGKVIATKFGSGSYNAFLSYIKAKGLKESDFRMENATPAVIISAMEAGTVDAGIWFEPTISIIQYKGLGRVLLDFEGHAVFQVYWAVTRAFAEKHPDVVIRFLAGVLDTQDMLAKDPQTSARLVAKGFKARGKYMPPEVLEMGIPLLSYSPDITPDKIEELRKTFAFFKKKGRIHGNEPVWQKCIDTGYLKKAQAIRK